MRSSQSGPAGSSWSGTELLRGPTGGTAYKRAAPTPPEEAAGSASEDRGQEIWTARFQSPLVSVTQSLRAQGGILPGSISRMVSLPPGTNSCSLEDSGTKRADQRMWQEWNPHHVGPREGPVFLWPKWEKGLYYHRSSRHSSEKDSKQSLWVMCLPKGYKEVWVHVYVYPLSESHSAESKSSLLPTPITQLIYSQQMSLGTQKICCQTGNEKNIHFFQKEGGGITSL